jgi:NADPH:quinone reductase-like Zn-dependent oxidoreductase
MKAILYDKKHEPYQLRLTELEKPSPKKHEVAIKTQAVSLNAADYRSMKMGMIPKSKIFGSAVSGTIVSVGQSVTGFQVGDAIVADLADFGFGGLAEFAIVPEKAMCIKPSAISFEDAVTLPVAATTALKAVRDKGEIQSGQSILIVGAGGGVGSFALQLAKHFGANVTAVCGPNNAANSLLMGADRVNDYTKEDFMAGDARYDLILAVNGDYSLRGYHRLLKSNGRCVMVGGSLKQIFKFMLFGWALSFGGKQMKTLSAKSNAADLAFVSELLATGKIKANVHVTLPFEQAAQAMHDLSQGHAIGKVVITV